MGAIRFEAMGVVYFLSRKFCWHPTSLDESTTIVQLQLQRHGLANNLDCPIRQQFSRVPIPSSAAPEITITSSKAKLLACRESQEQSFQIDGLIVQSNTSHSSSSCGFFYFWVASCRILNAVTKNSIVVPSVSCSFNCFLKSRKTFLQHARKLTVSSWHTETASAESKNYGLFHFLIFLSRGAIKSVTNNTLGSCYNRLHCDRTMSLNSPLYLS